ncbi:hypothetical protein EHH44_18640 [Mycolicibacter terrae]|uniref:Transmembrane protein n=2 Tax=Mycolicibacter TaxID=1073531 RepID=A0A1A2Y200_MYCSD|nr:hypothetical protein [Mycolicibacter terrae]OBH19686.1 hypothetical protein A5694_18115 [Mycolicibacter sinensis]OBI32035.1 hypothetical protein A5710_16270 [Mycolicibacter sinensis]RRR41656.1 hypothetical protein EHH44_18640 [Mycolicibacter terrae]
MGRNRYAANPPLYGMALIFCAIAIVALTAYLHAGWWSVLGYGLAAVTAVAGGALAFRDFS